MKDIGSGLAILGGVAGFVSVFRTFVRVMGYGGDADLVIASGGGIACSVLCFGLGIVALLTGGRMAGVLMLLPALLGTYLTSGFLAPAVLGALLAIFGGASRPKAEKFETLQTRLEKEVQQRHGAGR